MAGVRSTTASRNSGRGDKSHTMNAASHSALPRTEGGCDANFCKFTQSLAEVEVCGCVDWRYTATLAWSANAKTSTHAVSSRSRQQDGLSGLSGDVKGGISKVIIRINPTWVRK